MSQYRSYRDTLPWLPIIFEYSKHYYITLQNRNRSFPTVNSRSNLLLDNATKLTLRLYKYSDKVILNLKSILLWGLQYIKNCNNWILTLKLIAWSSINCHPGINVYPGFVCFRIVVHYRLHHNIEFAVFLCSKCT